MQKKDYALIGLAVITLLAFAVRVSGIGGTLAPGGGGLLTPGIVVREGTAVQPAIAGDSLGTAFTPWSAGYFTDLHASTTNIAVLSFTSAGGPVDFGGFALSNAGTITGTNFSATSTTATSTITNALGISTSTPATELDVNGYIKVLQTSTTTACSAFIAGSVFFNQANNIFWGCDGTDWLKLSP